MKRCIFGDVFSGYVMTVGQTGEKILHASNEKFEYILFKYTVSQMQGV